VFCNFHTTYRNNKHHQRTKLISRPRPTNPTSHEPEHPHCLPCGRDQQLHNITNITSRRDSPTRHLATESGQRRNTRSSVSTGIGDIGIHWQAGYSQLDTINVCYLCVCVCVCVCMCLFVMLFICFIVSLITDILNSFDHVY